MIKNNDRSGWFGASDMSFVCGNWKTKTFAKWWLVKLGLIKSNVKTIAMQAGIYYERKIAEKIAEVTKIKLCVDGQKKIKKYRLRINYDCESDISNYEIKTYRLENGFEKVPKNYWLQCQAQMFGNGKRQMLWAYGLVDDDYKNFFNSIDEQRLKCFYVERDDDFINGELIPRLKILTKCLKRGIFPREDFLNASKI